MRVLRASTCILGSGRSQLHTRPPTTGKGEGVRVGPWPNSDSFPLELALSATRISSGTGNQISYQSQFADQTQKRQAKQQELAKQSGQLEAEHQQAAKLLRRHRANLTKVANQLKAIQAKLTKLHSAETTLQEQERKLAAELAKTQTVLSKSRQQVALLESSKRDFTAAEALRKAYAESAE